MGFLDSSFQKNYGSRIAAARGLVIILALTVMGFFFWRASQDKVQSETELEATVVEVRGDPPGQVYIHVLLDNDEKVIGLLPTNFQATALEAPWPEPGFQVRVKETVYQSGKKHHQILLKTLVKRAKNPQ